MNSFRLFSQIISQILLVRLEYGFDFIQIFPSFQWCSVSFSFQFDFIVVPWQPVFLSLFFFTLDCSIDFYFPLFFSNEILHKYFDSFVYEFSFRDTFQSNGLFMIIGKQSRIYEEFEEDFLERSLWPCFWLKIIFKQQSLNIQLGSDELNTWNRANTRSLR